jgi:hypothetical protein
MAPKFFGWTALNQNPGEKAVYLALRHLPDDTVIFFEPRLRRRGEDRKPDFVVVHPEWGVKVLEVKPWGPKHISKISSREAILVTGEKKTSPVEQARQASEILHEMLEANHELWEYAASDRGKLAFPYRHAGVLPYAYGRLLEKLKDKWGEFNLLGKEDLEREVIFDRLARIKPRFGGMTARQVNVVCNLLDPDRFQEVRVPGTGRLKGVYDPEQVDVATADLEHLTPTDDSESETLRLPGLEGIMSDEARDVALHGTHVRLVRGFAGTGKTDVLILRARYLRQKYPDLDILVTTFNQPLHEQRLEPELRGLDGVDVRRFMQLCSDIYRQKQKYRNPQKTEGIVKKLSGEDMFPIIAQMGEEFVADEIVWMKETRRCSRDDYISSTRDGRGSGEGGRRMGRRMKEQMFDVFEAYQRELTQMGEGVIDWADLPNFALDYLQDGTQPPKRYDVVLIDEAQHFAPTWIEVIKCFLKPEGTLFMCEDPSQSVYRFYSWEQRGLNVRGRRTRWLRTVYRNTRQIFQAAWALIETNEVAQQLLAESGEVKPPNLDTDVVRNGDKPQLRRFSSWQQERDFIIQEVGRLLQEGCPANHIGLLHTDSNILKRYRNLLGPKGIKLYETKRQTGLEFTVVFVPSLEMMFRNLSAEQTEESRARDQLTLYMTMTRARDKLYLSYVQHWPELLDPVRPYIEEVEAPLRL